VILLNACGGGGDDGSEDSAVPPAPPPGIGAAGGTVNGPNGSRVVIPANALTSNTAIAVSLSGSSAPALPAGLTAIGQMFAFTPHGTTFAVPVTMTIPFEPATVPAGRTPQLMKTNSQNQWEQVSNATFGTNSVSGQVTSFSDLTVVLPPLQSVQLNREWFFSELLGDELEEVERASGSQADGDMHELFDHGPTSFDAEWVFPDGTNRQSDGIGTSEVFSSGNGVTYWVVTEAPHGNRFLPEDPIGSKARLVQHQTFVKNAANASYEFTLSEVILQIFDRNGVLRRGCPPGRTLVLDPLDPAEVLNPLGACDLVRAEVFLDVKAYTDDPGEPQVEFFRVAGRAILTGNADGSQATAFSEGFSRSSLWITNDFGFLRGDEQGDDLFILNDDRTYRVNLAQVGLNKRFTVRVETFAQGYNRAASSINGIGAEFGTAANAYLRDPLRLGGTSVVSSGVTLVETPLPLREPGNTVSDPLPCVPGPAPDPLAGTVQFLAPAFRIMETATSPVITVMRTGGTKGEISATFATSDGTAVGDVDYRSTSGTVFFADGDAAARLVTVPVIQDALVGESDKLVALTLSQPGGCAALGAQSTATLRIVDDDPLPPAPSGLDATFDGDGKASIAAFGGDRSAMALQSDGKIVMVGGTFTDFVLARFNADGSLDTSFGSGGKLTTDMVAGEQEEALAVAVQADGKIVVAGFTGTAGPGGPQNFALARYLTNGTLDSAFGTGGRIVTGVPGNAFALAIQPDGRIVVGGRVGEDIQLARFNASGTLDSSFGGNGIAVALDIAGAGDAAANLVLLPNGSIVVSGNSTIGGGNTPTVLARYLANGTLDSSFGTAGKVILDERVGEGLALQSDGKLVLVGHIETATAPATRKEFRVMRLSANGSPDGAFGTGGKVSTAFSTVGDEARAVTLQSDGKILVAGGSSLQTNPNFALARYNTNGTLDTNFNGDGLVTVDFFSFSDLAESVVVQPNGRIVLGGLARDNVDGYGVARIVP